MSLQIEGVYENGTIKLASPPKGVRKAKVLVTFLNASTSKPESVPARKRGKKGQMMTLGMFKIDRTIDEADFKAAEWRGDSEAADGR
jgi:hypothetical protein